MKGSLVLGLVLSVLLLSLPVCSAAPTVTFYPVDKLVSANSSFILRADPNTLARPIRITWSVIGGGERAVGSFPLVDGSGVCYFSNTDENSTCGPSPFVSAGEQQLYVNVITPSGTVNATKTLNVSGIQIPMNLIDVVDNTIYLRVGGEMGSDYTLSYQIFNGDLDLVVSERPLTYDPVGGRHVANHTFSDTGVYYVFLRAEKGGNSGSNVYRVYLPSSDYVNIGSEQDTYWLGENVVISGDASQPVSGEMRFPNGTKISNFVPTMDPDGSFSRTITSESSWPEGNYTVRVNTPVEKTVSFILKDLLEVVPSSVSDRINRSDDYGKTLTIQNLRDVTVNLSYTTTGDIRSSHVSLSNSSLGHKDTCRLEIDIPDVQKNMEGSVRLITSDIELTIPVEVLVEEKKEECPPCDCPSAGEGGVLSVVTSDGGKMISLESVENSEITRTIKIRNTGSSGISSLSFSAGGELSFIESDINLDFSGVTVGAGDTEEVELTIAPYSSGTYYGPLTISGGGGSDSVYLHLSIYQDMYSDIQNSMDKLSGMRSSLPSGLYTVIGTYLDDADSSYTLENYQEAKNSLDKANVLMGTAETVNLSSGGGFDPTLLIVVVIIIVIAVVAFFFLKKMRSAPSEEEYGEDEFGGEDETFEEF